MDKLSCAITYIHLELAGFFSLDSEGRTLSGCPQVLGSPYAMRLFHLCAIGKLGQIDGERGSVVFVISPLISLMVDYKY